MKPKEPPKRQFSISFIVAAMLIGGIAFTFWFSPTSQAIKTSDGLKLLTGSTVNSLVVEDVNQKVILNLSQAFVDNGVDKGVSVEFLYSYPQTGTIARAIEAANLPQGYDTIVPQSSFFSSMLQMILPFVIMIGAFYFIMTRMQGGGQGGNPFSFGKSKAKLSTKEVPKVKFADVKGEDEAVEELSEIKDFLTNNEKYKKLGAKIPRGVLLYGPPGTGKTLIARAVAGEAKVPFFSMSGSDFVEMFVGVGASRVRDLFNQAKQSAPAIIFVDEIDAVGRHRGSGLGGGHDEREQTLNQLLVEMDGFGSQTNVILIAATNRPDILDPALLRPGRFDRQVSVDIPDLKGRKAILEVHAKDKPIGKSVDFEHVAKRTPGYSGADLANVLNEAALLAARLGKNEISMDEVDESIDRVMAGPQKRTRTMNPEDLRNTAYHEAGHALVAAGLNYTDPVTKVTILPRGRALGFTAVMPSEDRYSVTRNGLLDQLAYSMGGRVAEEVVFHDPTTGASDDIEKASKTAHDMVTKYGMTAELGAVKIGSQSTEPIYGRYESDTNFSDEIAFAVDREVRKLIENAHNEAYKIITRNRPILDTIVKRLLDNETILEDELAEIFKPIKKLPKRAVWLSSAKRPAVAAPPIPVQAKPKQDEAK